MKYSLSSAFAATLGVAALLSSRVRAQSNDTVIQVFWITETSLSVNSLDQYSLAGSIVEADASSTVVAIQCTGANIDPSVCGSGAPQLITYGSTTWMATETNGNLGVTLECSIATNTQSAMCTGEVAGPDQIFTDPGIGLASASDLLTATTASIDSTSFSRMISSTDFTHLPVTITAGQEKLASASNAPSAASGNGAGSLQTGLGVSGLVAAFVGCAMMVL